MLVIVSLSGKTINTVDVKNMYYICKAIQRDPERKAESDSCINQTGHSRASVASSKAEPHYDFHIKYRDPESQHDLTGALSQCICEAV